MRIYRILAVVWLLLCSNAIFEVLWSLWRDISSPNFQAFPVLYSTIFTCLIFLAGIVASVCLFCGARWARWLLCCVIAIDAIGDSIYVVKTGSLLNRGGFFCILALVSILLLLLPKHEAVA